MSDDKSAALAKGDKADVAEDGEAKPKTRLQWVAGWLVVPGSVVGVLFGGGALIGAHFHESWFVRMIVWVVELFV